MNIEDLNKKVIIDGVGPYHVTLKINNHEILLVLKDTATHKIPLSVNVVGKSLTEHTVRCVEQGVVSMSTVFSGCIRETLIENCIVDFVSSINKLNTSQETKFLLARWLGINLYSELFKPTENSKQWQLFTGNEHTLASVIFGSAKLQNKLPDFVREILLN